MTLHYGHYLDKHTIGLLSAALTKHYARQTGFSEIVVVCVGTNRYAWDALGPAVGSSLAERFENHASVHIYGTLEQPVHALNLAKRLAAIRELHPDAYTIAVDASLGQYFKIGTLQLVEEPLMPGVGLAHDLPPVGHVHLKGIINNHIPLNPKVLEHGSLTFVSEMAEAICRILAASFEAILPMLAPAKLPAAPPRRPRSSGS